MYKHSKTGRTISGLTGRLFEYEVLGEVAKCVVAEDIKYLPFRLATEQAKKNQPSTWDPTDPPTDFANDLHAYVALKLGIDDWSQLNLFSSTGQALDVFHGVDAFFEYQGAICTLDLTLRNKGGYKADLEITPNDFSEESELRCLAGDIALRLKGGIDVVRM